MNSLSDVGASAGTQKPTGFRSCLANSLVTLSRNSVCKRRNFAGHGVIDAQLKDAIAIGLDLIHMHQPGSEQRSGGEGSERDAANSNCPECRTFEFPAVECHG